MIARAIRNSPIQSEGLSQSSCFRFMSSDSGDNSSNTVSAGSSDTTSSADSARSTVDTEEVRRFSQHSQSWYNI